MEINSTTLEEEAVTNEEQARYWLGQAEYWRQQIGDAEARFEEACKTGKTKMSVEQIRYRVYSASKENFGYQYAGRQMKSAQERATMYALFALLDEASDA